VLRNGISIFKVNRFWKYRHVQRIVVMPQSTLEMTKELVLAQIQFGTLSPEDMQEALGRIHQSMLALKSREEAKSPMPSNARLGDRDTCTPVEESSDPPAGGERCKPWVCREHSTERSHV
jgi:hypothetical protein